jgi:HEAT repeat protein
MYGPEGWDADADVSIIMDWFKPLEERRQAADRLGKKGDKSNVASLLSVLDFEKDLSMRVSVVTALGDIMDLKALDRLRSIAKYDRSPELRAAAEAGVVKIQEKHGIKPGGKGVKKAKKPKKKEGPEKKEPVAPGP